jgi:hypothetical protein
MQKNGKLRFPGLHRYLADHSSIVKTFAVQGLVDIARNEPDIRPKVIDILHRARCDGTRAMKARQPQTADADGKCVATRSRARQLKL